MKRPFAALLVLLGCEPSPIIVGVPFIEADRSALISVERGSELRVFSVDASKRAERPLLDTIEGFDGDPPINLSAIFYDRTLDAEGLPEGRLTVVSDGLAAPRGATRAAIARVGAEGDWAWEPVSEAPLPSPIGDLRFAGEAPCTRFELISEVILDDSQGAPIALLSAQSESALLVVRQLERTRVMRVDDRGETSLLAEVDLYARGAFTDESGRLWLLGGRLGQGAAVLRAAQPQGPFETVLEDPALSSFAWPREATWAPEDGAQGRFYAVGDDGALLAFSPGDSAFAQLVPPPPGPFADFEPSILWLAPGELLYADPGGLAVRRFVAGRAQMEATPLDDGFRNELDRVLVFAQIEGVGVFAGTRSGTVLKREQTGWSVFVEPVLINSAIRAIIPYGRGVLLGGGYGAVQQYQPGVELCPENTFLGNDLQIIRAVRSQTDPSVVLLWGFRNLADGSTPRVILAIRAQG